MVERSSPEGHPIKEAKYTLSPLGAYEGGHGGIDAKSLTV